MSDQTYAFVDGAYLRKCYDDVVQRFFGSKGTLDLAAVKSYLGAHRLFYYDCLNDIQNPSESEADYRKRVAAQEEEFNKIRALHNVHVRLGSLSGRPPRLRQKKVDVLLAVEALDHAVRKNMSTAALVAGDLDFAPLVDSLVRLGTYVHIWYERSSAARELYAAADIGQPIAIRILWAWSDRKFQATYPIPNSFAGANPPQGSASRLLQKGAVKDQEIQLWQDAQQFYLFMPHLDEAHNFQVYHTDRSLLERYFEAEFGQIAW